MTIDFDKLRAPFHPDDVEWRVGNKSRDGKKCSLLAYITARAVMDRLDLVVGPQNWRDRYVECKAEHVDYNPNKVKWVSGKPTSDPVDTRFIETGFLCTLEINVAPPDHEPEWIGKSDAADSTDIESIKGGVAGAIKRAAVKWGIGRYLYKLPEEWVDIHEGYAPRDKPDTIKVKLDGGSWGWCSPPRLPDWALPEELRHKPKAPAKETEEEKAARQSTHDKDWDKEKGRFFARIGKLSFITDYDEVCRFCDWLGTARPSTLTSRVRMQLLEKLESDAGANKYADFIDHEAKGATP